MHAVICLQPCLKYPGTCKLVWIMPGPNALSGHNCFVEENLRLWWWLVFSWDRLVVRIVERMALGGTIICNCGNYILNNHQVSLQELWSLDHVIRVNDSFLIFMVNYMWMHLNSFPFVPSLSGIRTEVLTTINCNPLFIIMNIIVTVIVSKCYFLILKHFLK